MTREMQRMYIRAWVSWPLKYRFARSMLWVGWRGQDWFWLLIRQECHRRFAGCVAVGAVLGLLLACSQWSGK